MRQFGVVPQPGRRSNVSRLIRTQSGARASRSASRAEIQAQTRRDILRQREDSEGRKIRHSAADRTPCPRSVLCCALLCCLSISEPQGPRAKRSPLTGHTIVCRSRTVKSCKTHVNTTDTPHPIGISFVRTGAPGRPPPPKGVSRLTAPWAPGGAWRNRFCWT